MFTLIDPKSSLHPWREAKESSDERPFLKIQLVMVHNLLVCGFFHEAVYTYLERICPRPVEDPWSELSDVEDLRAALLEKIANCPDEQPFLSRLEMLGQVYELDEVQLKAVTYLFIKTRNASFDNWYEEIPLKCRWGFLEAALGMKAALIKDCTDNARPLRKKDLISYADFGPKFGAGSFHNWELCSPLVLYLDFQTKSPWEEYLVYSLDPCSFTLESFPFPAKTLQTLSRLVCSQGGFQLLFYGRPGTGKTSLALTLAQLAGKPPLFLGLGSDNNGNRFDRQRALIGLQKQLTSAESLLIIDEADDMLQGGPFNAALPKAWLNSYLDTNQLGTIWIVNDWDSIHPSILRRFHFVLEFSEPKVEVPQWEGRVPEEWVPRLTREVSLDRGDVSRALETWERVSESGDSPHEKESCLREILQNKQKLVGRLSKSALAPVSLACDRSLWNADSDLSVLEVSISNYLQWLPSHRGERQPFSVLCSGLPGTGKTEWIKYQAQVHHKKLRVYRPSDLLSKWVGESEKNIASAFRSSQEDDFLLLDEVDSLLASRATATHSWEVTQVNELLTQMENYPGVIFCATNFFGHLDEAVSRRFLAKIVFRPLTFDQIRKAWDIYFPEAGSDSVALDQLTGLTAGDFKTVWSRWRFATEVPATAQIFESLLQEKKSKERIVGGKVGF